MLYNFYQIHVILAANQDKHLMNPNVKLSQEEGDLLDDPSQYRRMICNLLYLTLTRLDLSYLSKFLGKLRIRHMQAVHRVFSIYESHSRTRSFFLIFIIY